MTPLASAREGTEPPYVLGAIPCVLPSLSEIT